MDRISKERRSWNMSRIRSSGTSPERVVRSMLHKMGYRFRLKSQLFGKPDIVLPKYKTAIFVHGCFWHRHEGCKYCYSPKSNIAFWNEKFQRNIKRDKEVEHHLAHEGWRVLIIWECEITNSKQLQINLQEVLKRN